MFETQIWGLVDYKTAWARQKELAEISLAEKKNFLALCEHPSVITIGRGGGRENILCAPDFLESLGVGVETVDRGGDVTLHNPGQLVGYPIFNLENYKKDLHWFLREIEQTIIDLLAEFDIQAGRAEGMTGVWIDGKRKICAIGLHCSRWVITHGFALNVNNDIREFDYIVPCGIKNKEITSISKEVGAEIDMYSVRDGCVAYFEKRF